MSHPESWEIHINVNLCIQSRDAAFSLDGEGLQEITIFHNLVNASHGAAHKIELIN